MITLLLFFMKRNFWCGLGDLLECRGDREPDLCGDTDLR